MVLLAEVVAVDLAVPAAEAAVAALAAAAMLMKTTTVTTMRAERRRSCNKRGYRALSQMPKSAPVPLPRSPLTFWLVPVLERLLAPVQVLAPVPRPMELPRPRRRANRNPRVSPTFHSLRPEPMDDLSKAV